jgi:hypothetical protein
MTQIVRLDTHEGALEPVAETGPLRRARKRAF